MHWDDAIKPKLITFNHSLTSVAAKCSWVKHKWRSTARSATERATDAKRRCATKSFRGMTCVAFYLLISLNASIDWLVYCSKALLRRHQTVHSGIKEFACPKCSYQTSHKSNLERHCLRVHHLIVRNHNSQKKLKIKPKLIGKAKLKIKRAKPSQCPPSDTDLTTSQQLVSSHEQQLLTTSTESLASNLIEYKPQLIEAAEDAPIELIEPNISTPIDSKTSTETDTCTDTEPIGPTKCDNKKLRLCLRPYKCLICWLLFESQLEYFEHQLLTDHMIKDSEQMERLEVIRAAAVLTQFSRSGAKQWAN